MTTINAVANGLSGVTGSGVFVGATNPILVTPNIGTPSAGVITNCTGSPVLTGVTDGSAAAAGKVGEVISSSVNPSPGIALTSNTPANVTSITLTAGDWDIFGQVNFLPANTTTVTNLLGSISLTSATVGSAFAINESYSRTAGSLGTSADEALAVTPAVNSVSGSTIYYLVANAIFGTSTMAAGGKIIARRRR